jgi:hypothetical protein
MNTSAGEGSLVMKHRRIAAIVSVAAVTFLAGCSTFLPLEDPFAGGKGDHEVRVHVTNLAFSDVTIYGIANGSRHRLGRVTGKREVMLKMPLTFPAQFFLEIDFLAGPKCLTETLTVDPGDDLELIVQNENLSWNCRGG